MTVLGGTTRRVFLSDPCHVLVTGDVVLDRHIYEGERSALKDRSAPGTRIVEEVGGAAITHRLIEAVFRADFSERLRAWNAMPRDAKKDLTRMPKPFVSRLGLTWSGKLSSWPAQLAGSAWFSAQPKPGTRDRFWRVSRAFGYGAEPRPDDTSLARRSNDGNLTAIVSPPSRPAVLLDEAGDRFRRQESEALWHLPEEETVRPDWIVLKLAGPIGTGDLWDRLMRCQPERRLIVLVSAKLLRLSNVRLSRGLSWECTVEQLRTALTANPILSPLRRARHLIVSFEGDGAVWIDFSLPQPEARLIFDAEHAEGEWGERIEGDVFGYQACLAASVAYTLAAAQGSKAEPDFESAIERGLAAMRNLREDGHGLAVSEKGVREIVKGFPAVRLAGPILHPASRFTRTPVPWVTLGPAWSILASLQNPLAPNRPLHGFARQLAIRGESVIEYAPHLHIGKLLTVDREEIETLRSLRSILKSYGDAKSAKKPLSIGVFGKPGSGKSFAVEQLAVGVFGEQGKSWNGWMEFNLSQFDDTKDLIGAFHQVRDRVLQGLVPVVFWDEFDSDHYKWLRFLLAPMQDGRFQEDQITHTLGKCVFVFAGGTSETFEKFGEPEGDNSAELKLLKVPDFKSRLDGSLNVVGPNPQDDHDIFFPIRRALMIRNLLGCGRSEELDIDAGLLTALLEVPKYEHGARSLGKVLDPFIAARRSPRAPLRRSQLPAQNQLSLHVKNVEEFHALCERDLPSKADEVIENLALAIHETWRELAHTAGEALRWDMPFDGLPADVKRSNEAAARRIPDILALVGLRVMPGTATTDEEDLIRAQLKRHLELLAEEEHRGWMAHLESEGWRFAKIRDDDKRLHDCLRPFHSLREADKEKDRNSVRHFPDFVRRAGFRIEFG